MVEDDRKFYRRRIEQERSAADSASSDIVRDTHLELLELYTAQLSLLSSASMWQTPAPSAGRRSFSALFASAADRPPQAANTALPTHPFMLHRRPL
jgi:hypothetical protein